MQKVADSWSRIKQLQLYFINTNFRVKTTRNIFLQITYSTKRSARFFDSHFNGNEWSTKLALISWKMQLNQKKLGARWNDYYFGIAVGTLQIVLQVLSVLTSKGMGIEPNENNSNGSNQMKAPTERMFFLENGHLVFFEAYYKPS